MKFLQNIVKDKGCVAVGFLSPSLAWAELAYVLFSGRMADVKFLFKREGRVNVVLDGGDDVEDRLEKLVEVALDADAEDFESEDLPDGSRTVEVCSNVITVIAYISCVPTVQVPSGILA